jgi:hypothetical protein
MQVSVREPDDIPSGNRLPPVVFEQEYATTFERNPNLFGGWIAVRWIDGSSAAMPFQPNFESNASAV